MRTPSQNNDSNNSPQLNQNQLTEQLEAITNTVQGLNLLNENIGKTLAATLGTLTSPFKKFIDNIFGNGSTNSNEVVAVSSPASALNSPTQAVSAAPNGLTIAQLRSAIASNPNLSFLQGNTQESLDSLLVSATRLDRNVNPINYSFNALANNPVFPHNNGRLCCAYYVSSIIGFAEQPGSTRGAIGSVTNGLLPTLIKRNLDRNGTTGIVLGVENFRQGDVLAFRGTAEYGAGRYGHTGIVRDVFTYNGVQYMAMQHESRGIQVEFIPVNPHNTDPSALQAAYNDPSIRQRVPALQSAYEYRGQRFPRDVRFINPERNNYYKDASKSSNGRIAFAIRTTNIQG